MKTPGQKILFAISCLLINFQNSNAQTLTCASTCPQAGEVFSIRTSSPVLNSAGTNQVWNFSNVAAVSQIAQTISYDPASAIPSASLYPLASLVKTNSNGERSYISTNNGGIRATDPNMMNGLADAMILPLPFAYGDTYVDSIPTTTFIGTDYYVAIFQSTIVANGTGTLILPSGSYSNVLSIKYTSQQSTTKNGSAYGYVYYNTSYYYYAPNISQPLLYTRQLSETGPTEHAPYTEFIDQVVLGIESESLNGAGALQLRPNPANDIVHVTFPESENGRLLLRNALGEMVIEQPCRDGAATVNVSGLSAGIYFISVESGAIRNTKKIIISRS